MKKFLYMAMALLVAMTSFTACGDDDKDEGGIDISGGVMKPSSTSISEKGNQLIFTAVWTNRFTETHTATFNDSDQLTSYLFDITYPTSSQAEAAWQEYMKSPDASTIGLSRHGNTITQDFTADYQGIDMATMRIVFESLQAQYEKGLDVGLD